MSDSRVPLRGRRGPTLTVADEEIDAFETARGVEGLALISIRPADRSAGPAGPIHGFVHGAGEAGPSLDPRDRVYELVIYHGPLSAVGYQVVVRRVGSRWLLRHLQQQWIA